MPAFSSFVCLLAALSLLGAACTVQSPVAPTAAPVASLQSALQTTEGVRHRAIVLLDADDGDRAAIASASASVMAACGPDVTVRRRFGLIAALAVDSSGLGLERLRAHPRVVAIADDPEVVPATTAMVAAGSPSLLGASAAAAVAAPQAWAMGLRGGGSVVAVVDSGVDVQHPDLAGRVVAQQCFAASGCPPYGAPQGPIASDINGHGTHVASIIAGRGKVGPSGIAPDAKLVALRALGGNGKGLTSDVLAALDWLAVHAAKLKVRVVNLSLGGSKLYGGPCDSAEPALAKAIALLRQQGVVAIGAAGNGGATQAMSSPACLSQVVAVGATYAAPMAYANYGKICSDAAPVADQVACFSNRNKQLVLVAAGVPILGASVPAPALASLAGTSQAAPAVAAVAALIAPCWPQLEASQLVKWLQATGVAILDKGSGTTLHRVHAGKAALACLPWG